MMRYAPAALTLMSLMTVSTSAAAQALPHASAKSIRALPITSAIHLDGRFDELVWTQAEAAREFVQQEPLVGEPATERTEVRVLLDEEAIYIGVTAFDGSPEGIIARERRRDDALLSDDRFEVILDTFHDHRNGFHFVINPLGTQYDALVTDEGQDVNVEWDERWTVETSVADLGWTAEIRIPFTTLRSRPGIDTFGINFKRFIRRKNETAHWTGWDRDFSFLQLSQAGHLLNVQGVRAGLRLRVKPYVLGGFRDALPDGGAGRKALRDVGIETLKVSLTPGLTAELTANTDFAQVEIDEAVVNLSRFPVFFPEKREFFLENAGIFEFGLGGRRGGAVERNLQMFFSRRIGLTEDRRPVPILGGGKITGRTAGFDLGVLNVQTDRFEDTPGSNYSAVRAKRNILARSNVGMFLSNRHSADGEFNRVFGADANFTFFKNTDLQGFLGRSLTSGRTGNDLVGRVKYNAISDLYEVFVEHLYIGPEFQHDLGYVRRSGVQRTDTAAIWEPRPGRFNIRNFVFRGELIYLTDIHRRLLTREQIFQTTTRFQNDDAVRFNLTNTFDRLEAPFEPSPGVSVPAGGYTFTDGFAEVQTSEERPWTTRVRVGGGAFYGGMRRFVRIMPSWRPSALLSFETAYEFNDVRLPDGAFSHHLVNARMNFNVSNKWLTTMLAQYDSVSRQNLLYVRLNYIFRPGDDLFVVYTQSRDRSVGSGSFLSSPNRSLIVKMTYSLDF